MNVVLLTGRLTRDPELRTLASGRAVTQFGVATNEYVRSEEKSEYHNVVTWGRLAEICGQYLTKGQSVAIEGRLQTRSWDDDKGVRHWKTEVNAQRVEMLGGRRKKDYDAEAAAHNLEQQAAAMGLTDEEPAARRSIPAQDPIAEGEEPEEAEEDAA
jgi:single-strand DNA-binding protein